MPPRAKTTQRRIPYDRTAAALRKDEALARAKSRAKSIAAKYGSDAALIKNAAYIAGGGGALAGYLNAEWGEEGIFGQDPRLLAGGALVAGGMMVFKGEMKAASTYVGAGVLAVAIAEMVEERMG